MKENIVKQKSFHFALRIVKLYKYLTEQKKEYIIAKQIMRSGTAIGALVREAEQGESKRDFVHKLSIALKEANETAYWLDLLHQSDFVELESYQSISKDLAELISLLVSIIKTSKSRMNGE